MPNRISDSRQFGASRRTFLRAIGWVAAGLGAFAVFAVLLADLSAPAPPKSTSRSLTTRTLTSQSLTSNQLTSADSSTIMSTASSSASVPCITHPFEWGTTFYHYDDGNLGVAADAELLKKLGLKVVRLHSYYQWPASEPYLGSYSFQHQDRSVANLAKAGLKVVLETPQPLPQNVPSWAGTISKDPLGVINKMVPFVSRLASRYKGKVAYYQLGNEIDYRWSRSATRLTTDWLTDDVLAHYFNTMISTVKEADPNVKIMINCVADADPRISNFFAFLKSRKIEYDIIGIQTGLFPEKYIEAAKGWDLTPEVAIPANLDLVKSFGKPIWISEVYLFDVARYTRQPHPIEDEIEMLKRAARIVSKYPEVTGFLWCPYEQMMSDPWYWYGLVNGTSSSTDKKTTRVYDTYKSITSCTSPD